MSNAFSDSTPPKARIRAGRKRELNYRKHGQTLPEREECERLENGLLAPD